VTEASDTEVSETEVSQTERVIGLFANDLSTYGDFLADFAGDPEEYGVDPVELESFSSTPAAGGEALARYVSVLRERHPGWAGVDIGRVDWPTVSASLERHLLRLVGLDGLF
jgi:hypothetical protein